MRSFQLIRASILAAGMMLLLASCSKENQNPEPDDDTTAKLLPRKLVMASSLDSAIFVYDNQNHLVEQQEYIDGVLTGKWVYTYQGDKPVKQEFYNNYPGPVIEYYENSDAGSGKVKQIHHYRREDDSWGSWTLYYFLDDKGRVLRGEWEDGTIFQKLTWDAQGRVSGLWYKESADLTYTYKYDDKKGIFSAVNNPFFFDAFLDVFARNYNVNNLTEMTETYINGAGETKTKTETVTYKYNEQGYPTEIHSELDLDETDFYVEYQPAK